MTDPTADAAKLLPCPFCGGAPEIGSSGNHGELWFVECNNCHTAETPLQDTSANAVTAWNTRPQPAPPAGEPDFETIDWLLSYHSGNPADLVALLKRAYRLGIAARPKVEDAEVAALCDELRRPSGIGEPLDHAAMTKAADLLERLSANLRTKETQLAQADAVIDAKFPADGGKPKRGSINARHVVESIKRHQSRQQAAKEDEKSNG